VTDDPQILSFGPPRRRGHPCRSGTRSNRVVKTYVTDSEKDDLREIAKLEGKTLSDVVRSAINEFVGDFRERVVFLPSGDRFPPTDS
jgi:hypothetical protein